MNRLDIKKQRQIIVLRKANVKIKDIAAQLQVSESAIKRTIKKVGECDISALTDEELNKALYDDINKGPFIDFEKIKRNRISENTSITDCWKQYVKECESAGQDYVKYAMFCRRWNRAVDENLPESVAYTFWLDERLSVKCDGKDVNASIFVGFFPYSGYIYYHVYEQRTITTFIKAHNDFFDFINGIPLMIVTMEFSARQRYQYEQMIEHYKCEYQSVKKSTLNKSMDYCALLSFDSSANFENMHQVNEKLKEYSAGIINKNKRKYSYDVFCELEREKLAPKPRYMYSSYECVERKVLFNNHVRVNGKYYSAPWQYIGNTVSVHIYNERIDIYNGKLLIARHDIDPTYNYITDATHLPRTGNEVKINRDYIKRAANQIGECVEVVIENILDRPQYEQQAYKECIDILNLSNHSAIDNKKLERAAFRVLNKQKRICFENVLSEYNNSYK